MLPQINIIDIIHLEREQFSFKTENKACFVLACRLRGESLFFYNGREIKVERGRVLYIPLGSTYSQCCERESLICFHLNISGELKRDIELFSAPDPDRVCELFIRAEKLWREKPDGYEFACMSILCDILSGIDISNREGGELPEAPLSPAMDYLTSHLYDPELSWDRVCRAAHISRTYFNMLFRELQGCTPTQYLNRKRIERAKQLLASGSYYNEEIAGLCGFKDVKYFYVIFKKITGVTTKQYKKSYELLHKNLFVP